MHERTQRRICIALFFALCVLPTTVVIAMAVSRSLPGRVAAWEDDLSRRLGLIVELDEVSHPRPGAMLLAGMKLLDPESRREVARIRLLELARRRNCVAMIASQPEVHIDQVAPLWDLLHDRLLAGLGSGTGHTLVASELTVHQSAGAETLSDVRCGILAGSAQSRAAVRFQLAGQSSPASVRLEVIRDRRTSPETRVELQTDEAPLPCCLLAARFPGLARLGSEARFQGTVRCVRTGGGWSGEIAGQLRGVDLDDLVSQQFPHKLSGTADVTSIEARFHDGRVNQAGGILVAGPGVVSRSLIDSAAESMGLVRSKTLETAGERIVSFRRLAFGFEISNDGLLIAGRCGSEDSGVVLAGNDGPLVVQPTYQPLPVVGLVRALVPNSQVLVPATRETDRILRTLPVPSIVLAAQEDDQARVPGSHLRFARGLPDGEPR